VTIDSAAVSPTSFTVTVGATQTLTATALDSAGNAIGTGGGNPLGGRTTTWTSADARIADVSSTGVVTGNKRGNTTIDVSIGGSPRSTVTVAVTTPAGTSIVSSVAISPSTTTMIEGTQATFSAYPLDSNGDTLLGKAITWSVNSADGSLSTVAGATTTMTALDSGTVVVAATSDGQTGRSTVSVALIPVDTIESVPASRTPGVWVSSRGKRSETVQFRVLGGSKDLVRRAYQVTSANASIAAVSIPGTALTDGGGRGEFVVSAGRSARRGDTTVVTLTVDGKSTRWAVTIT
jgi:hypothetical protein